MDRARSSMHRAVLVRGTTATSESRTVASRWIEWPPSWVMVEGSYMGALGTVRHVSTDVKHGTHLISNRWCRSSALKKSSIYKTSGSLEKTWTR